MIPIKIQCSCGQKYAFDVEPVSGQMANSVACPVCGADGTATANQVIAQALGAQAQVASAPSLRMNAAPPSAPPVARPLVSPIGASRPVVDSAKASSKLRWYEQLWIALPIALVSVGGAIGGACGGAAWAINQKVFQKLENPFLKYVVTGLISGAAVILWLIIAVFFLALFKKH